MCYHKSFKSDVEELQNYFPNLAFENYEQGKIEFTPNTHISAFSHANHPIIYRDKDKDDEVLTYMEWGVIPAYIHNEADYKKQRLSMANIRSEKVLGDHKSYWYKIRNNRCLIPVNGFYEYRGIKGWKNKVPYYIHIKDQPIFFLPGLFSVSHVPDKNGEAQERHTYALITRPANSLMHKIHNAGDNPYRMPLMLPFEMSEQWINKELPDKEYNEILDYSMPTNHLQYHTVFSLQSPKGRPDDKEKDEPFTWEKLPALGEAEPSA